MTHRPPIQAYCLRRSARPLHHLLVGVVAAFAKALKRPCVELGRIAVMSVYVIADRCGSDDASRLAHAAQRIRPELLGAYPLPSGRAVQVIVLAHVLLE